jgi:phage tail sheath protein FI
MGTYKTPGVYITETNAFLPSVVGVETAVPAFIGYTEKAVIQGASCLFKPIKITAMAEFEDLFGSPCKRTCQIVPVTAGSDAEFTSGGKGYRLQPKSPAPYNLYYSMCLFFANGGGNCYIVSVGNYDSGSIAAADLQKGLTAIRDQFEPTLLVIPEAISLSNPNDFASVTQAMLQQCSDLRDRMAILDVWGAGSVTQANIATQLEPVITAFQTYVGDNNLSYGAAYFPLLNTSVADNDVVDYTWFDVSQPAPPPASGKTMLQDLLMLEADVLYPPNSLSSAMRNAAHGYIDQIATLLPDGTSQTAAKILSLNRQLSNAVPAYAKWQSLILKELNLLPPSAAMAGAFTQTDNARGVWSAPANIGLTSTLSPSVNLTDAQQNVLNVPLNGKAVDVIRYFTGRGPIVWGARTLDGDSSDWRYIQVRRNAIYIETSISKALSQFVFAPNTSQTWIAVIGTISNFLQGVWSQGGLMGNKASDAFSVSCGLGSTMTAQDVLDGYMIVQISLQMIRPAEFIELTFKQQMQGS